MRYTNEQLKQALAKMLSDKIHTFIGFDFRLAWNGSNKEVLDTELLHLCFLIEESLSDFEKIKFTYFMYLQPDFDRPCDNDGTLEYDELFKYIHASWQQRVIALAKIKNIEII